VDVMVLDIPLRLRQKDFRFVLLVGKRPFEDDWETTAQYQWTDEKIRNHNGNIGIVMGTGGLCSIDCDTDMLKELSQLDTFIVKTGGLGEHYHIYFICKDFKDLTNHQLADAKSDFRCWHKQCVLPPSTHPDTGKKYEVFKDVSIKEVTAEEIKDILKKYQKNKTTITSSETPKDYSRSGIEFGNVCKLIRKGYSKEKIWQEMKAYAKWSESQEQYREHTYKRALDKADEKSYQEYKKQEIVKKTIEESAQIDATKWKLQQEVYTLLLSKDAFSKGKATELIVKAIKEERKFYTIRSDEKNEMWVYHDGIYVPQGESYIKEFTRQILGQVYSPQLGNNVTAKIQADTYIDPNKFFNQNNIKEIPIQNGILNLKTREILSYTQDKIFFNKLPIKYDPQATCEAIEQHFKAILKHEEDLPVMYEIFGFLLWKEYFIEKAIMFTGDGRNGKGKTIMLMERFLGKENCTNVTIQGLETDKYKLGELFNKMANLSGDLDKTALKHTGNFKSATGRDPLGASRKFMIDLQFINYAKFIFSANELPKTHDITPAFWNRWILLEFPYTFISAKEYEQLPNKEGYKIADPNIISKLSNEDQLSGLLNKALDGLDRLHKQGDFSTTKNTEQLKSLWIRKSDSFTSFITECCEEGEAECEKGYFKKCYIKYCKINRVKQVRLTEMISTLDEHGVFEQKDGGTRFWSGIKIKEVVFNKITIESISEIV
jgi:putative DNA primase/helicase